MHFLSTRHPGYALVAVAIASLAGCSEKATSSNANPTAGDSSKCVWDDKFQLEALDAGLEMVGPPAHIAVGDNFQSVTACNGCGCTERGLECTHNACPHTKLDDYACPSDTFQCPDGPLMRRFGPNCLFPTCDAAKGHSCLGWLLVCVDPDGGEDAGSTPSQGGPFCTMTCP